MPDISAVVNWVQLGIWGHQLWGFIRNFSPSDDIEKPDLTSQPERGVTIVMSSLYAAPKDAVFKEATPRHLVGVSGGYHVTGLFDALGLAKLAATFAVHKKRLTVITDWAGQAPLDQLNSDVVLIGGSSSNLAAGELQDLVCHETPLYAESGRYLLNNSEFGDGATGHILWMENPWSPGHRITWLAGLGPAGTGAAIEWFLLNQCGSMACHDPCNRGIQFIKGTFDSSGQLNGTDTLDFKAI